MKYPRSETLLVVGRFALGWANVARSEPGSSRYAELASNPPPETDAEPDASIPEHSQQNQLTESRRSAWPSC